MFLLLDSWLVWTSLEEALSRHDELFLISIPEWYGLSVNGAGIIISFVFSFDTWHYNGAVSYWTIEV